MVRTMRVQRDTQWRSPFAVSSEQRMVMPLTESGRPYAEVGSQIDLIVMLPEEVGLPVSGMVCCHAHVVRSDSGRGQYGIAVEIDRLAPVPQV